MFKLTERIIYFLAAWEILQNNGRKICAASVCGFEVSGTLNLMVAFKDSTSFVNKQSVAHAQTLEDALTGEKWSTIEEAENWGIILTYPDQDIEALVNP